MNFKTFLNDKIWYHGSVSGDLRGGRSGLHLGTMRAAKEALVASIGHPAEGEWDGTKEYGKTLLAGKMTLKRLGIPITGRNVKAPENDYYPEEHPEGQLTHSDGTKVNYSNKPSIEAYKIVGQMTNSPMNPHEDFKANGYMARALKLGNAKKGYYYKNVAEDEGSISAVVPNGSFVRKV